MYRFFSHIFCFSWVLLAGFTISEYSVSYGRDNPAAGPQGEGRNKDVLPEKCEFKSPAKPGRNSARSQAESISHRRDNPVSDPQGEGLSEEALFKRSEEEGELERLLVDRGPAETRPSRIQSAGGILGGAGALLMLGGGAAWWLSESLGSNSYGGDPFSKITTSLMDQPSVESFLNMDPPSVESFLKRYKGDYKPATYFSKDFLNQYLMSEERMKNIDSVRVYHAKSTLLREAMQVIQQREAVNIGGSKYGCEDGNERSFMNGFEENPENAPLPVSVYSASIMVNGNDSTNVRMGAVHVPALAFDSTNQIHWNKYITINQNSGVEVNFNGITKEYTVIANSIVQSYIHHAEIFGDKNSGRMLIAAYGSSNFLSELNKHYEEKAKIVRLIIAKTLTQALIDHSEDLIKAGLKELVPEILLGKSIDLFGLQVYDDKIVPLQNLLKQKFGEKYKSDDLWPLVPKGIQYGDFGVNAWDPNSCIGNGNAQDWSLDGFYGRSSAHAFEVHCGPNIYDADKYIKVDDAIKVAIKVDDVPEG